MLRLMRQRSNIVVNLGLIAELALTLSNLMNSAVNSRNLTSSIANSLSDALPRPVRACHHGQRLSDAQRLQQGLQRGQRQDGEVEEEDEQQGLVGERSEEEKERRRGGGWGNYNERLSHIQRRGRNIGIKYPD